MSAVCQPGMALPGWCFACEDGPGTHYWLHEGQGVAYELCGGCFGLWENDARGLCGFCGRIFPKDRSGDPKFVLYDGHMREVPACRRCFDKAEDDSH